ncbi:hypothetical protein [Clostridium sulfidigenes]|uniref:hypothetical protein n=1 Tax=Clostridium sulfidigenes TaxID=318464 RepID=UPI003F8B0313
MGVQKNASYKVHNGTDFDEINFKTIAAQVKTAGGSDVESQLAEMITFINSKLKDTGLATSGVAVNITNGEGSNLFKWDNSIYFFIAQDNGITANSITGICLRRTSHFSQHAINVLHSNGLSLGVKNSMGTQVINGASANNITCIAVRFPFAVA